MAIHQNTDQAASVPSTRRGEWFRVHRVGDDWALVLEQERRQCLEGLQ
jgi:hypothetical protein